MNGMGTKRRTHPGHRMGRGPVATPQTCTVHFYDSSREKVLSHEFTLTVADPAMRTVSTRLPAPQSVVASLASAG